MSASQVIFYLIAPFILICGLLAVTAKKIFRAAIWLLFSLIGIAGFYFWMDMQFIAAVQIVVYVGGIVVLIIFSIFLTHQSGKEMAKPLLKRNIFSAMSVLFGFAFVGLLIYQHPFKPSSADAVDAGVSNIGAQMLSTTAHGYLLPFEVVSVLLLAAMIGCIVIATKTKREEQ